MRLIDDSGERSFLDNQSGAAICALMSTRPKSTMGNSRQAGPRGPAHSWSGRSLLGLSQQVVLPHLPMTANGRMGNPCTYGAPNVVPDLG
jgi:hypothetical protein